jgi:histidine ammonia-lyase
MILQYVSAALLAELHLLANPTTTSNVPVSMEKEDHVSMGATATNRLSICCDHLSKVLANELICACEALHRIEENAGSGVMSIQNIMADLVAPLTCDRSMTNDTEIVAAMLLAGGLSQL